MTPAKEHKHHFLHQIFFLDVLTDRRARPVLIYAAVTAIVGAFLYHWLEGWNLLDSVYFVMITLTTIGYGDLVPSTPVTKLLTVFYGLNGVVMLLMLFDVVRRLRRWEIRSDTEEAAAPALRGEPPSTEV